MDEYRYELKYVCSETQLAILQARMKGILAVDPHARDGSYCIRSLYFDDYNNSCFFENRDGTDAREKYRIRVYVHDFGGIRLERKRSLRGKTQKTACPITREQCFALMNGEPADAYGETPPLMKTLVSKFQTRLMRPKVIVEYDRTPYIYESGNVRITLDKNIRSSNMLDGFFDQQLCARPVMPRGQHVLEVKYDGFLPSFLRQLLQLDSMHRTAYSKYYFSRNFSL